MQSFHANKAEEILKALSQIGNKAHCQRIERQLGLQWGHAVKRLVSPNLGLAGFRASWVL